jgi:hypothetical protein
MDKNSMKLEVPAEMREMVDSSVKQAREGFQKFMETAGTALTQFETKADAAQDQLAAVQKKTVSFVGAQVHAAFDLAEEMLKAKNVEEIVRIQSAFVAAQVAALKDHASDAALLAQDHARSFSADMMHEAEKIQALARETLERGIEAAKTALKTDRS